MITLPHAVSRYLSDFRIAAIFVSSSGVIGVATPRYLSRRSAVACWWCTDRASAEAVLVAIGESTPMDAETAIRAAADRLGIVLADHSAVLKRAEAAVGEVRKAA